MDCDVIICWPMNCDYPLWRKFIKANRHWFNDIIVVFTKTNQGYDYSNFVKNDLEPNNIICIENRELETGEDWRDVAINQALSIVSNIGAEDVKSDWVWFTEQDLIVSDDFLDKIDKLQDHYNMIGYFEGARLHPANLWVKRKLIDQTNKNFGIVPDKLDHFGLFYKELIKLPEVKIKLLEYPNPDFKHLNGLSHNMSLLEQNKEIVYKPLEFRAYLEKCLFESGETLHPEFKKLAERARGLT